MLILQVRPPEFVVNKSLGHFQILPSCLGMTGDRRPVRPPRLPCTPSSTEAAYIVPAGVSRCAQTAAH